MPNENEIIDDLQRDGLVIIRDRTQFAYGNDAVLLSDFCRAKKGERLVDMGTGTGILPLLIHAKTGATFLAAEIQEALCDMAARSVALNGLENAIEVVRADVRTLHDTTGCEAFDGAVCNPPYYTSGTLSPDKTRAGSTHTLTLTPFEMAASARRLIKNGGRLYTVFPAALLAELFYALRGEKLEPKRIALVRPKKGAAPYIALVEAKKGGRPGLRWDDDMILEENE